MSNKPTIIGTYKSINPNGPVHPRYDTPITPKENFKRFIAKDQKAVWTPSETDLVSIMPKFLPDVRARALVDDPEGFDPVKEAGGYDLFGIHWTYVPHVGGSMESTQQNIHIEDVNEWEKVLTMPNVDDLDWAGGAERLAPLVNDDRATYTMIYTGFFERLISFMGFEAAAMALIDEEQQEGVHRLFSALCEVYDAYLKNLKKYFNLDMVVFHDDWGSQRAPFFSNDTCMEMLVPYIRRVRDSAHKYGIIFELHSCGKNDLLIESILATGADLWGGQNLNDWDTLVPQCDGKILLHIGWNKFDPETMTPEWYLEDALNGYKKFENNPSAWIIPSRRYVPGICDKYFEEVYARSYDPTAL